MTHDNLQRAKVWMARIARDGYEDEGELSVVQTSALVAIADELRTANLIAWWKSFPSAHLDAEIQKRLGIAEQVAADE